MLQIYYKWKLEINAEMYLQMYLQMQVLIQQCCQHLSIGAPSKPFLHGKFQ